MPVIHRNTAGTSDPARRKLIGRMGPWQLVHLLGEGSMSRVYAARPLDSPDAQPVYALKALRKEWWRDAAAVDTIRREAWVGRRVNHPGLPAVLSAQVTKPPFHVVTPRLTGSTLKEMLTTPRRPGLSQALWIARQIAEALSALHTTTGMVHGDVKPGNVFVSPDGHATLLDLGFCRSPEEARARTDEMLQGTLSYLAPEALTSVYAVDPRSDLYSLGATLYEIIAGRPPFEAASPGELVSMHLTARPEPLDEAAPGTPASVARLVDRMLAKQPIRRPSSADEIVNALTRLEIASFAA